jgi:uncharacterized protein (TIGR02270 family)
MTIENIISTHVEEASFLWLLRDAAVTEPHYTLTDLKDLEERIDAHLDGLRVAGNMAWPLCEAGLQHREPGEVFAAAFTALDKARQDWLDLTLEVVHDAPECTSGLVSALGWLPKEKLQGFVVNWLKSEEALLRQIGLSACAIQRVDCGGYLTLGLRDCDAAVRARALRSIGELRRRDLLTAVTEHMDTEESTCRFWAAWSATLLGDTKGISALQPFFEIEGEFQQHSLILGLRAMDKVSAVNWVRAHSKLPGFERAIIEATGTVGDPVTIPWLISLMQKPQYSRLAGESFTMITGVDLAYEDLDGDQPEGFEAGPSENPEDEDVAMDLDEELPWPDHHKISQWWDMNQERFTSGERYLTGSPITHEHCLKVLKNGYQRQRRAAAIELALLNPEQPLFNTSATAKHQMQLLGEQ